MSVTQGLEAAVVALIAAVVTPLLYPDVEVAPLPSMVSEYSEVVDGKQIWVNWHGIKGGEENSTQALYQSCNYQFGVVVRARKLRDNEGLYNLIDLVNKAILGKRPADGTGWLKLTKWESQGETNGVFTAMGIFECPGIPLYENYDINALDGAAITRITYQEQ